MQWVAFADPHVKGDKKSLQLASLRRKLKCVNRTPRACCRGYLCHPECLLSSFTNANPTYCTLALFSCLSVPTYTCERRDLCQTSNRSTKSHSPATSPQLQDTNTSESNDLIRHTFSVRQLPYRSHDISAQ